MNGLWKSPWVLGFVSLLAAGAVWKASVQMAGPEVVAAQPAPVVRVPALVRSMAMGSHMAMTMLHPKQPSDDVQAAVVLAGARSFAEKYVDYRKAEADGFVPILPEIKQTSYHFQRHGGSAPSLDHFDPANPAMLIYEKVGKGYKLVGVMYTAPFDSTEAELNARIPLSYSEWHAHVNFCRPPKGYSDNWIFDDAKYGMSGSIVTEDACKAAGGVFVAHGGWMAHVFPFHTEPEKIWNSGMVDDHGQSHEGMGGMMGPM